MVSELLDEIEGRIRLIVREEIERALIESQNPSSRKETLSKHEARKTHEEKEFPQLLTAPQVAEILGVSVARVYDLTRQRKRNNFPVILIGERSYRFSKDAILAWLERD